MIDFDYISAGSIDQVIALLQDRVNEARVFCGGTDLLVQMRERKNETKFLIDIKKIPEVMELCFRPGIGLVLGAGVSCLRISQDAQIRMLLPGLVEAVSLIGGIQIQGRASVGGNLCNASPAADAIPALIVHRAICQIIGPNGWRDVKVENFCVSPGKTVLNPGEFLVRMIVPEPPGFFGAAYQRFIPRNEMDIAVAGVGASVVLDPSGQYLHDLRIAMSAVAPLPLYLAEVGHWAAGKEITESNIDELARMAQSKARPIDDLRGTIAFRREIVGVLTRRTLISAIARARGGNEDGK